MNRPYTETELEAYLDESLPGDVMARIEEALRGDEQLGRQLAAINSRRDAGIHSLGEVWRRERLSCTSRELWGSYLLGAVSQEQAEYLRFHLEVVGCRYCQANLEDLQAQQLQSQQQHQQQEAQSRRQRYFQSSAGYLGNK